MLLSKLRAMLAHMAGAEPAACSSSMQQTWDNLEPAVDINASLPRSHVLHLEGHLWAADWVHTQDQPRAASQQRAKKQQKRRAEKQASDDSSQASKKPKAPADKSRVTDEKQAVCNMCLLTTAAPYPFMVSDAGNGGGAFYMARTTNCRSAVRPHASQRTVVLSSISPSCFLTVSFSTSCYLMPSQLNHSYIFLWLCLAGRRSAGCSCWLYVREEGLLD